MVFGWGKKKTQQYEEDITSREKEIFLTEIPDIIKQLKSIKEKTVISETGIFRNKIKSNCDISYTYPIVDYNISSVVGINLNTYKINSSSLLLYYANITFVQSKLQMSAYCHLFS